MSSWSAGHSMGPGGMGTFVVEPMLKRCEELAELLGVETFLAQVEQGPFYVLFLCRFNEGAEGGLVNDNNLRVLDKAEKPFPGLYAAGDCCRGLIKEDDWGGKFGEMGWAMASGFLAAQEMAGYTD